MGVWEDLSTGWNDFWSGNWTGDDWGAAVGAGMGLLTGGIVGGAISGGVGALVGGIFDDMNEKNKEDQEGKKLSDDQIAANAAATEAEFQAKIRDAQTMYDQMLADAARAEEQNEWNLESNVDAMGLEYGYQDESGTSHMGSQNAQVMNFMRQGVAQDSARQAQAGLSGLKKSGSLKAVDAIADEDQAEAEIIAAEQVTASFDNALVQTERSHRNMKSQIADERTAAETLKSDWGGSFSWEDFQAGNVNLFPGAPQGVYTNNSRYATQYRAGKASQAYQAFKMESYYDEKLQNSDPWNLFNYSKYINSALQIGSTIAQFA